MNPFINRVTQGDCIKLLPQLPDKSIDFVLTDPPYLVRYRDRLGRSIAGDNRADWLKPAFEQIYRVLKPDSFCVSFYGWSKVDKFFAAWRAAGFYPVGHLVFVKPYASSERFLRYHHEQAYLLAKGRPDKPAERLSDVLPWQYTENRLHPTQKPISGLLPLIFSLSMPHDIVLDPFCGSGSTLKAAQMLGRRYIGFELDEEYCKTARQRL